jgi:hypothetical protein
VPVKTQYIISLGHAQDVRFSISALSHTHGFGPQGKTLQVERCHVGLRISRINADGVYQINNKRVVVMVR